MVERNYMQIQPKPRKFLGTKLREVFIKAKKNQFMFEELTKRDFKKKYKGTILGMGWSVLSPLLSLLVMRTVFSYFFAGRMEHFTIYLFAGNLVYSYFKEATSGGMNALRSNASIFTKINVPKYLFLLSKNVSSIINFGLTLIVFFLFVAFDKIPFSWRFLLLIYPVLCLTVFNIGFGLILSALYVFFKDTSYLYDIFTLLLMYLSAIFYDITIMPEKIQKLFLLNPMYCYIKYFRVIVIEGSVPSLRFHILCLFYAVALLTIGGVIYKVNNHKFLYYV